MQEWQGEWRTGWARVAWAGAREPPSCAGGVHVGIGCGAPDGGLVQAVGAQQPQNSSRLHSLSAGSRCDLPPVCDIPSGCCCFTGPWTVTRSSLRMLRRVAAFCRPLRPVLLLTSFPRSQSPVVGVLGLC